MSDNEDGGPVFPVRLPIPGALHANGVHTGLSKRELFAAILMHSEAVTCGVPGEAADALVEAAERVGRDVVDHMAHNAVEAADALLRALTEPAAPQYRELYPSELERVKTAERLAHTVETLQKDPAWSALPEPLRIAARDAVYDVLDPEIPF